MSEQEPRKISRRKLLAEALVLGGGAVALVGGLGAIREIVIGDIDAAQTEEQLALARETATTSDTHAVESLENGDCQSAISQINSPDRLEAKQVIETVQQENGVLESVVPAVGVLGAGVVALGIGTVIYPWSAKTEELK